MSITCSAHLAKLAAKDNSRYAIAGVQLASHGSSAVMVATDGRMAAWCPAHNPDSWSGNVIIDSATLAPGCAIVPNCTGAAVTIPGKGRKPAATVSADYVEGNFPDVSSVVDTRRFTAEGKPAAAVTLNADMLKKLLDAVATENDCGTKLVTILVGEMTKPVFFLGAEATGIMMPVAAEIDAAAAARMLEDRRSQLLVTANS